MDEELRETYLLYGQLGVAIVEEFRDRFAAFGRAVAALPPIDLKSAAHPPA